MESPIWQWQRQWIVAAYCVIPLLLVIPCRSIDLSLECQHDTLARRGWTLGPRLPRSAPVELTLAIRPLSPGASHGLHATLNGAQDSAPLTLDDLAAAGFSASQEVISGFNELPPASLTVTGDFIRISTSVGWVEAFFPNTEYHQFTHPLKNGSPLSRSITVPHVPEFLSDHLEAIEGLCDFPKLQSRAVVSTTATTDAKFPVLDIHRVNAGDRVLNVTVCFNSTSAGQTVTAIQVQGAQSKGWAQQQEISAEDHSCLRADAGCCVLSLHGAQNFKSVQLKARLQTSSGWMEWAKYQTAIVPSPFATPRMVRDLYKVPADVVGRGTAAKTSVAVLEFDGQFYSQADLHSFSRRYGIEAPDVPVRLIGPNNESACEGTEGSANCGESTLDIQWLLAVAPQLPVVFWSVEKGFLLSWFAEVSNMTTLPDVISISYGEPETDIGPSTLARLQTEFGKLAARRITVISTSGDLGSSDGSSCATKLSADYPSSSTYTTSLGATQLVSVGGKVLDTAACSMGAGSGFTTGGMFSAVFARPAYQDKAVEEYLTQTNLLPDQSLFNVTGRAYNDVGALGSNIPVIIGGDLHITGGTSASGPIFAGLMGLLNDELLAHGKRTVGWINPWMYQNASASCFRAVNSGFNGCTEPGTAGPNGNGTCCPGFSTLPRTAAWNPLGGLGTPLWDVMRDQLMKEVQ